MSGGGSKRGARRRSSGQEATTMPFNDVLADQIFWSRRLSRVDQCGDVIEVQQQPSEALASQHYRNNNVSSRSATSMEDVEMPSSSSTTKPQLRIRTNREEASWSDGETSCNALSSVPMTRSNTVETVNTTGSAPIVKMQAMTKTDHLRLNDFEVLQTLGTGTFGRVLLVHKKGTDVNEAANYFALKALSKSQLVQLKQIEHVNSEREVLHQIKHPFIVNLHATFQDSLNVYMLMEYVVGGEIFTHLRRAKRFSVHVTRFYIATLVLALKHLHSKKIIYRDLKPENLVLDAEGYLKMTDFGFSKKMDKMDRTWTLCGTPEYLSPEVIESNGQSYATDYWSLGILMYEMLCGHPPFFDSTPFGTYEKILRGYIYFPGHVDASSRHLIQSLLTVDVSKRLGK
jgi:hypothetical protein